MNPQAQELNTIINSVNPSVNRMFSEKGKNIFFPKAGIMSQAIQAKGKRINATIGIALEEDGSPMRLDSIDSKIDLDPSLAFPYATSFGRADLRSRWAELQLAKNPGLKGKSISQPVVTNALTHGLSTAGYMFVETGDTIILPEYFWGNYKLIFINGFGANIETYSMYKDGGFNVPAFSEALTKGKPGKRIVLLNFPNNPTGYTPTQKDIQEVVAAVKSAADAGNDIVVMVDDAYFGLVYENGIEKESIFTYLADLHENVLAIKIDGATKEDYVWGFRVGFMTFGIKGGTPEMYEALINKAGGAVRGNISNVSNLSQSLVNGAYASSTYAAEKQAKYTLLNKRYKTVKEVLANNSQYTDYFEPLPYNSGYFMCVQLKKGLNGNDVRVKLLEEFDTGIIAIGNVIRVAYSAVPTADLSEIFENIYKVCRSLAG